MPIRLHIDRKRECVITFAFGDLTDRDLFELHRRVKDYPDFRSHFHQLLDGTNIDRADISSDTIYELARDNPFAHGSRRAIVVDAPYKYGLARIYQAYTERCEDTVMIFWDTAAAARWLGIDVHPRSTSAAAV